MSKRNFYFIIIFAIVGLLALQIPVAKLFGSDVSFTVFDSFGPMAAAFIGLVPGVIAVAVMQLANFFVNGADVVDAGTIVRFFPMLFAAWYFAKRGSFNIVIPVLAIIAFVAHPTGREVWYYSMFWLIPIAAYFFRDRFLLARTLGTTFTAHAVGGALWIWFVGLPAAVWQSLIPIVAMERILFAMGMAVTYVLVNNLLDYLVRKEIIKWQLTIDRRYLPKGVH